MHTCKMRTFALFPPESMDWTNLYQTFSNSKYRVGSGLVY